jgi:hypothetical protein
MCAFFDLMHPSMQIPAAPAQPSSTSDTSADVEAMDQPLQLSTEQAAPGAPPGGGSHRAHPESHRLCAAINY